MSEFEITALDEPEPWDRQLQETSDQFLAFTTYRGLGPKRTFAQTARDMGLHAATVAKMAEDHHWKDRIIAWDFYQDRVFQAEITEHTRTMARRHVRMAEESLKALQAPVEAMNKWMEENPEEAASAFAATDPKTAARLLKQVQDSSKIYPSIINAERLAVGQPTDVTEHTENINYGDAERIGEVLDVLQATGVLDAILGKGEGGEIVDAEIVGVDDDRADDETDGLSAGAA